MALVPDDTDDALTTIPTESEEAEDSAAAVLGRRNARREVREEAAAEEAGEDTITATMTEAAVLGEPEEQNAGPLVLMMRAPVSAKARGIYNRILREMPDIVLTAALGDPSGTGIDFPKATAYAARVAANRNLPQEERPTEQGLQEELQAFGYLLLTYDAEQQKARMVADPEAMPHPLDSIADILFAVAGDWNDGLTREAIPDLLLNRLCPEDYADLLRAIMNALCGSAVPYRSDLRERFFRRDDGELPQN